MNKILPVRKSGIIAIAFTVALGLFSGFSYHSINLNGKQNSSSVEYQSAGIIPSQFISNSLPSTIYSMQYSDIPSYSCDSSVSSRLSAYSGHGVSYITSDFYSVSEASSSASGSVQSALPVPTTEPDLASENAYQAYLMTFFVQTGTWLEQYPIRLAYSYDGLHWLTLTGDTGVTSFKSRDPHIFRRDNNTFVILTSGSYGYVNIIESKDMCSDIQVRQIKLGPEKVTDTWAGEIFKDPADGMYMIHYTVKLPFRREHVLYYVKTRDFITFTEPKVLISENGIDIIDSSIFYNGTNYYLLFKNDDTDDTHIVGSISATGPYHYADSKILLDADSDGPTEGAFILHEYSSSRCFLYYDLFMENGHWGLKTMFTNTEADVMDADHWKKCVENIFYTLPKTNQGGPRHGNAITITKEELDKLIMKWKGSIIG